MDANKTFTPAQEEALRKAYDLLGEHFDRVVMIVDTEVDGQTSDPGDATDITWKGGFMAAMGMIHYAHARLTKVAFSRRKVGEDGEEYA